MLVITDAVSINQKKFSKYIDFFTDNGEIVEVELTLPLSSNYLGEESVTTFLYNGEVIAVRVNLFKYEGMSDDIIVPKKHYEKVFRVWL